MDKRYWTSLEDLAATTDASARESDVRLVLESLPTVDRRSILKLLGLSLAAGALAGCRKPVEKIIPYVTQPSELTPGVANWYATTCHGCSAACGALAKVMDGRPIRLEGNPDHLMSRGGLCATGQGAIISLYDAHRQKAPAAGGTEATWESVDREIAQRLAIARSRSGRDKVVVLTGTVTGPASQAVIRDFLATFPRAEHVVYDPVSYDALREAHRQVYGQPLIPGYRFDKAEVIISFGADFLGTWLSPVEFTKQYAAGRDPGPHPSSANQGAGMSQHFQLESRLSLTGSNADYRYAIAPSEQAAYLAGLVVRVAKGLGQASPLARAMAAMDLPLGAEAEKPLARTADALLKAPGRSLVVADSNDVTVQLLALALNDLLGNVGRTVDLGRPSLQKQGRAADVARLVEEMGRGEVAVLLIHGCNPAYTYPDAGAFLAALKKVPCSISFAISPDETTAATHYHCPAHHPMESWGDAEPQAGRFSLFQPTIRPLYRTRAFEDSLLKWSGRNVTFYDYLKQHWQAKIFPRQEKVTDFATFWDQMLQRGFLEVSLPAPTVSPLKPALMAAAVQHSGRPGGSRGAGLEAEVFESLALRDGSAANNPWLQEVPDPITKITWDNCAAIAPALAREKGIEEGQWLEIVVSGGSLKIPAHIQPGQHPRTVSVALGYGRTQAGPVGNGVGVNAYPLLSAPAASLRGGAGWQTARAVEGINPVAGPAYAFARTQIHSSMEGRPIVQETTYEAYRQGHARETHHEDEEHANLWQRHEYPEYKWGMVIDLNKCTGCSACVTACDLENNVPVVGRNEVRRQREMHWLRIDRYFTGDADAPEVVHQPLPCQQCDNASCETVCPVLATVHDDQGLNVQVYNRCVGTRYCANNCAYKCRRFNFFNNISNDLTRNLALNPDVTVRSRGVMEKCSFCIQRIQAAKIQARREGRKVSDGEVQTACQQSCPADAIVFGNLVDRRSAVARQSVSPRSYRVLEELNRQPSVYYLAKIRNRDKKEG
ncbi:MAG: 4Fe-4S dicluster domain-containing protein [Armatimonadetes bacterium]|nr:4Fe-4S dicluster domain-containing protein [Armatimonadota bacterium]